MLKVGKIYIHTYTAYIIHLYIHKHICADLYFINSMHTLEYFISKVKLLHYFHSHHRFFLLFFISCVLTPTPMNWPFICPCPPQHLPLSLHLETASSCEMLLAYGFHKNAYNLDHTPNCFDTWFPKFPFFHLLLNLLVFFSAYFLFSNSWLHLWNGFIHHHLHSLPLFY